MGLPFPPPPPIRIFKPSFISIFVAKSIGTLTTDTSAFHIDGSPSLHFSIGSFRPDHFPDRYLYRITPHCLASLLPSTPVALLSTFCSHASQLHVSLGAHSQKSESSDPIRCRQAVGLHFQFSSKLHRLYPMRCSAYASKSIKIPNWSNVANTCRLTPMRQYLRHIEKRT